MKTMTDELTKEEFDIVLNRYKKFHEKCEQKRQQETKDDAKDRLIKWRDRVFRRLKERNEQQ